MELPTLQEVLVYLADPVLPIILIVVIALVAVRFVHVFVRRAIQAVLDPARAEGTGRGLTAVEVRKRVDTLDEFAVNIVRAFILVIAGIMILGELGLNIGPAIAGLGVVGIAVGFGAQSLVRDYFTGALILIENQYGVGDVVSIAGVSGSVEEVGLRRTVLRDLSGVVHSVPNGEVKVASNMTRIWARINEDVQVAYDSDIPRVIETVNAVGQALHDDPEWGSRLLEPPSVLRVQALGDSGVTVKVLGMVRAGEQWAVAGELRRRLLDEFARSGIEIPFPHRVIISRPGQPSPSDEEIAASN